MQSMGEFITAVLLGMVLCFIILLFLFVGTGYSPPQVYQRAYRDMHEGRIEQFVKENYPELWIQYNIDQKKEE